jgi:hypothetical protein
MITSKSYPTVTTKMADLTGIPAASMVNRGVAKLFRSRVDFPPSTDP